MPGTPLRALRRTGGAGSSRIPRRTDQRRLLRRLARGWMSEVILEVGEIGLETVLGVASVTALLNGFGDDKTGFARL